MVYDDGVDCRYKTRYDHRGKPDKRFYSHKFKKSALRYEVASCIRSDNIVWISGPHLPGIKTYLVIFREGLKHMLEEGEHVEADAIYAAEAPQYVKVRDHHVTAGLDEDRKKMRGRAARRHENVNRRLKVFKSLEVVFRHSAEKHSMCFRTSAILIQLSFENGDQALFDVREYDDTLTDFQAELLYEL